MRLASSSIVIKFLPLAMAIPSLGAQELRLEDAIQLAIEHNADIANAKLDVAKSGERIAASRTSLFPITSVYAMGSQLLRPIEFTIQRGELGSFGSTGPIPSNDVKFSTPLRPTGLLTSKIAEPLTGIYKTRLGLKSLDISKQIDQEHLRAKSQDVVREVKRIYYQIQQKESSLKVTREMVALYRELERVASDYVLKQVALEPDHLEAQTSLLRAEQDQITLGDDAANLKEQLNQLLGRDVLTEFTVTPIAEIVQLPLDLAVARNRAIEQRPELQEAKLKVQQAEQEVRIKHADYIPDVSAEFNMFGLLNYGSFLPTQSTSVGISLSWTPMDWGRRKHQIAEKKYSLDQSKNSEADTRNRIIVDVDAKYRQMHQAQAQLRVARMAQQSVLEQLRITKRRFELEAVLLKEVLQVQTNLEQANNDYQQTLAKFLTAQAEFEHALGEDQ